MSNLAAADGLIVGIFYTLKDENGEVLDTNRKGGAPLAYLHGSNNIVAGLEKALAGKVKDDFVDVVIPPEEGYGEHNDEMQQEVERSLLPDSPEPQPGMQITGQTADGQPTQGMIVAVNDDKLTVDFNHPLAGKSLHFEVTIAGVREATEEEKTHGHAHGKGGHDHG